MDYTLGEHHISHMKKSKFFRIRTHRDLAVEVAPVGDEVEDVWQVEDGDEEEERVGPDAEEGDADEAGRGGLGALAQGDRVGRDGQGARDETQPLQVALNILRLAHS